MQRAKRRLTCSRASVSSLSNASARMQRSSRTSSAGGDCVAVSQVSNRFADIADSKIKLRPTKHNARFASANYKNPKKSFKVVKSQRPTFGSLQNAVVLAPFHTLKRAYQTKLVDLYSQEKSKKLNNKVKMAKKQNVSFEYNVLEVKPPGNAYKSSVKRETPRKKKLAAKKGQKKRNANSGQKVYCQCDNSVMPNNEGRRSSRNTFLNMKATKQALRSRMTNAQLCSQPSPKYHIPLTIYDRQIQKKRKMENKILQGPMLKNGTALKYSESNDNLAEGTSQSLSNASLRNDSWETFSDSLSFREERLEGSLIISTTSFDSCLEQSSNDGQESMAGRCKQSRYNAHLKMIENLKRSERMADYPSKARMREHKNAFANREPRASDDRINNFMNLEPFNHAIACSDAPKNMQLLPLLSKTKNKKSDTGAALSSSYYLRSSRERPINKESCVNQAERLAHRTSASTSRRFYEEQIMKRKLSRNTNGDVSLKETEKKSNLGVNTTSDKQDKQTHFLFQSAAKTVEESYSQTDEIFASLNQSRSGTPEKLPEREPAGVKDMNENTLQVLHQRKSSNSFPEREKKQESLPSVQRNLEDKKPEEERLTDNSESGLENRLPEGTLEPEEMTTATTTTTTIMIRDMFPGVQKPFRFQDISH